MLKDLKIDLPTVNERERIPPQAIELVVDHIVQTFKPEQVILFGSYAAEQPEPGSDVDLLVVLETENSRQAQLDVALSFQAPFGLDILVRTPEEMRSRLGSGDTFLHNIVTSGKVLYQRTLKPLFQDILMNKSEAQPEQYVQEWVQKAEGDFLAATSLLDLHQVGVADAVCFHTQQCAEKYANAYLTRQMTTFERTHDSIELLRLCLQSDADFAKIAVGMQALNSYSVETRYPGRIATLEEAEGAVGEMKTVRAFMRTKLDLKA